MNKTLKRAIIGLMGIAVIVIIFLAARISSKTYYNETNVIGNTAGNLYNGGLFCEHGDRIYFSNFNDDGVLYSMDLACQYVEKLGTDKPCYINADDHYVYYSRINYTKESQNALSFYNRGIYRMEHDGSELKMLYKDLNGLLSLFGNTIYYQHYTKEAGITFHKVSIDKKSESKISNEPIIPCSYYGDSLYYAGVSDDHYIHSLNMETNEDSIIYAGNCYMPIATEKGIYFISLEDNYALCFVDYNGENKTVLVDRFCSTYNISNDGKTIYYQLDGGNDNRICKLDVDSLVTETIIDGNYKNIHITSSYVFFRDYTETNTYAYTPTTGELRIFNAPVISEGY